MERVLKYQFGRFKISSIINCICFFALCFFCFMNDFAAQKVIIIITCILYGLSLWFWWFRLKNCTKIVGIQSSQYFPLILFPILGQMIAYYILKKAVQSTYFFN